MNALKNILAILLVTVLFTSCKSEPQPEIKTIATTTKALEENKKQLDPNATYAKAEFTIEGMTCQIGCANTIQKQLVKMEGIKSAKVDFESKLAMVEFDESKQTVTTIENTVSKVSDIYKVKDMKTVDDFSTKTED